MCAAGRECVSISTKDMLLLTAFISLSEILLWKLWMNLPEICVRERTQQSDIVGWFWPRSRDMILFPLSFTLTTFSWSHVNYWLWNVSSYIYSRLQMSCCICSGIVFILVLEKELITVGNCTITAWHVLQWSNPLWKCQCGITADLSI